ncbi:MAG TPA: hypothetical protein PKL83_07440, partial [bacterium]|nr:hypothetical protein [bacterium]
FMTRGPFGLLPLILLGVYAYWYPGRMRVSLKHIVLAFVVFCIIVIPWHVYMHVHYGTWFWDSYMGRHMLDRFGTALENHHEPWWFYFPFLLNFYFFAAGVLTLLAVFFLFKTGKRFSDFRFFLVAGFPAAVLLIITLGQTKLAWYLMPAYPFFALLTGSQIAAWKQSYRWASTGVLSLFLLVLVRGIAGTAPAQRILAFREAFAECAEGVSASDIPLPRDLRVFMHINRYQTNTHTICEIRYDPLNDTYMLSSD